MYVYPMYGIGVCSTVCCEDCSHSAVKDELKYTSMYVLCGVCSVFSHIWRRDTRKVSCGVLYPVTSSRTDLKPG